MKRHFATLVFAAAIGFSADALAQGNGYAPLVLPVACGGVLKAACAKVLPRLAARTMQAGVELKPAGSGLALDTASAVCDGQAAGAIVQRDAIALAAHQPACQGRFDVVGRPLYPWYAFLVVKAGAPFRELNDMAGRRVIVAGEAGSSGQITLGFLLRANPALQHSVAVSMGDMEFALARVAGGLADGFFALDTLDSDMIDRVRLKSDARGKPLYTFIDIRPTPEFFRIGDGGGHCLYRLTALDFGEGIPVTTVSVDAVMVLGHAFHDAHARSGPRAFDAIASAIDVVEPAVLADMKSPGDWRPVGTSCQ
jgi:hypothetical protein